MFHTFKFDLLEGYAEAFGQLGHGRRSSLIIVHEGESGAWGAADVFKANSVDARTRGSCMWRRTRFIFHYRSLRVITIVVRIGSGLKKYEVLRATPFGKCPDTAPRARLQSHLRPRTPPTCRWFY